MTVAVTKVFGRPGPEIKAKKGDYSQDQITNGGARGIGLSGPDVLVDFTAMPERLVSINLDQPSVLVRFKFCTGVGLYWVTFVQQVAGSLPKMVNVDGGLVFVPRGFALSVGKDAMDLVTIVGSGGLGPSFASLAPDYVRQPGD